MEISDHRPPSSQGEGDIHARPPDGEAVLEEARVPAGYGEVLRIAVPLILSTASLTATLFVDRMLLSWHSLDAVAAAVPGGITYFTICAFFLGSAQYVNTIVAQHHGAGDKPACARAVWQGLYFSAMAAPLILATIPLGRLILVWSDHAPHILRLEIDYFSILMIGGIMFPVNAALSSFFSGRGRTMTVLWGNAAGNAANIALDYVLIFGKLGFPEMGIKGAAIATAVTQVIPALIWLALFLSSRYRSSYRSRREYRFDPRIFGMLIRYGVPSGVQLGLDVGAFAVFILLVGRLGRIDLAITNIVTSIEMLSFLPMIGMSIATATLVGEYLGRERPDLAEKSVYSALKLALAYMGFMAALFFVIPETFLGLFRSTSEETGDFGEILRRGTLILRLVAIYTIFDTMFIVFSGALKGAGDTRFAMWVQAALAWFFFVPPVYVIIEVIRLGLLTAWGWGITYVILLGVVFWLRFRSGRWREIRMLEKPGFEISQY